MRSYTRSDATRSNYQKKLNEKYSQLTSGGLRSRHAMLGCVCAQTGFHSYDAVPLVCVEFHVKFYDSKDVCVTISSYSKYLHMNSAPFVHAMEVTRNCLASNVFSSDSLLHLMDLQDTQVDSWGLVRIFMAHYPAFINTEGLLWVRNLFWKCAYNSRRIFLFPRSIVPGFLNELWAFVCLRFVWIMLSNIYYVN